MLFRKAIFNHKVFQQRLLRVQALVALREITDLHSAANLCLTLQRCDFTKNSTQQRRLAGTVGTQKRSLFTAAQRQVNALGQHLLAVADSQVLHNQHSVRTFGSRRQTQLKLLMLHRRINTLQTVKL